jgi:hypothetical protein
MARRLEDGSIQLNDGRVVYANSIIQGQDLIEILDFLVPCYVPPPLWPFVSGGGGSGVGSGSGAPGPAGPAGANGNQGNQGFQGPSMGPIGPQGPQGDDGVQGPQGNAGAGTQGPQGEEGPAGDDGVQGPQGNAGAGTQGPQGEEGSAGDDGAQGPQGNVGAGTQGPQGEAGENGVQGPQGSGGGGSFGSQSGYMTGVAFDMFGTNYLFSAIPPAGDYMFWFTMKFSDGGGTNASTITVAVDGVPIADYNASAIPSSYSALNQGIEFIGKVTLDGVQVLTVEGTPPAGPGLAMDYGYYGLLQVA